MSAHDPARLGPYRLLERLGAGAMGEVWLAHDGDEDRRVALKVFAPALVERQGFLTRFEREAEAGSRIEHPNVVRTFGAEVHFDGDAARCFLVMEYVEGKTLRALAEDLRDVVPEALLREIGHQVAAGLAAIHGAGLVHRDLKPENVLLTPEHVVRIMDLGVAKHLAATRLTQEGQFAGSLLYAAPEQIQGREVTFAADLYALGVLLFELASGVQPFDGPTLAAVMHAHLAGDVPDLAEVSPDSTPFVGEVVRTLLAKHPSKRFGSAAELARVLDEGERSAWWREHEDDALRRRANVPRVPVRRETALHGRDGDLAVLRSAWQSAREGRGNTVLLSGEAGIGKSRLVDALFADLKSEGARVLYGSYPPVGGMGGISDAITAHLGADDLAEKLEAYLRDAPLLAAPLAALLRHEPPPPGSVSLAGDALHAALVRLMRAFAAERPLVWVVEDLHFADADQRKLALSLARAVEGHPVLLVLTSRPGLGDAELAHFDRLENLRRVSLDRLGAREVMLLLRDALRNERLAEKLGVRVALASDGNPFFVFETIRALRQGQLITQLPDGTWVDTKVIDQIPVPEAVRDLIEARLRDLSREDRELLDVGAVLGFEFDPDVVADVVGRKRLEVLRDLAHVERTSGVVRAAGREHRFDHHQIQEIVYADLPQPLREELHAAVAEAIERRSAATDADPATLDADVVVALARHFLSGARGARAVRYLDTALRKLGARFANEEMLTLADAALAVPGLLAGSERMAVLATITEPGSVLDRLGRRDVHRARLEEFAALAQAAGDRGREARALTWSADLDWKTGRLEESRSGAERAVAIAREIGDATGEAEALRALSVVAHRRGRPSESEALLDQSSEVLQRAGLAVPVALVTGNRANLLYVQGKYPEALAMFERSLELARAQRDTAGESRALGGLSITLFGMGRLDESRSRGEERLALARAMGDRNGEASALGSVGNALWGMQELAAAAECHLRSRDLARELGDDRMEGNACGNLGNVLWSEARFAEAREQYGRQSDLARRTADQSGEAIACANLGAVAHALGHYADACDRHSRCLEIGRRVGNRVFEATALVNLGSSHLELGDAGRARAELREGLAVARETGNASMTWLALKWLGDAARWDGDTAEAGRLRAEADEVGRTASVPELEPESHLSRGRALVRDGRLDDARAALEAAVRLAQERSFPTIETMARVWLARLPGGDLAAAAAHLRERDPRLERADAMSAWFVLWEGSRDAAHLAEAKRILDLLVEHAPPECREPMVANVPLHRGIAVAAKGVGL